MGTEKSPSLWTKYWQFQAYRERRERIPLLNISGHKRSVALLTKRMALYLRRLFCQLSCQMALTKRLWPKLFGREIRSRNACTVNITLTQKRLRKADRRQNVYNSTFHTILFGKTQEQQHLLILIIVCISTNR